VARDTGVISAYLYDSRPTTGEEGKKKKEKKGEGANGPYLWSYEPRSTALPTRPLHEPVALGQGRRERGKKRKKKERKKASLHSWAMISGTSRSDPHRGLLLGARAYQCRRRAARKKGKKGEKEREKQANVPPGLDASPSSAYEGRSR